MGADLYIHAMRDVTESDLRCFFSHSLDSRWENLTWTCPWENKDTLMCHHWKAVMDSPSVWIGGVSWLKAIMLNDPSFVPEPVQAVYDLIGERLPVLDRELGRKILEAVELPTYRSRYRVTEPSQVFGWLEEHLGERLFTVSW